MSFSDSSSDLGLPHFETIVTCAVIEPQRSLNYRKNDVQTNKSSKNSKSNRILQDWDAIEVDLSDHNNNEVNSISKVSKSFSYDTFKNQLSIDKENSREELHPLTSTRLQSVEKKQKSSKRGPIAAWNRRNVKRVNYIESSSDDEDIFNELVKEINKEPNPKSVKRGGPIVSRNQRFKKFKPGESHSEVHPQQSLHKSLLPEAKPKPTFFVESLIGYAKNNREDDDFWSLSSLSNPPEGLLNSVPKPNDGKIESKSEDLFSKLPDTELETLNSKICASLEPVLEDGAIILAKPNQDDLESFSRLANFLEFDSDNKPNDESETSNIKIDVPSKPHLKDGSAILSNCNPKTDEEMHSGQGSTPITISSREKHFLLAEKDPENNVDEFAQMIGNMPPMLSQYEAYERFEMSECAKSGLLTKGRVNKSDMEICEWIATGVQENQEDEIFKQAEQRLKEISEFIQMSLTVINGPITFKNHKFYNLLLDLEDKLNTHFVENSYINEQDFDNLM